MRWSSRAPEEYRIIGLTAAHNLNQLEAGQNRLHGRFCMGIAPERLARASRIVGAMLRSEKRTRDFN